LLDLTDVLSLNFVASYANKAYVEPRHPSAAANNGDLIEKLDGDYVGPMIENYLRAEIASRREYAANAVEAISIIQTFDEALSTILEKLGRMQELAEESSGSSYTYSDSDKAEMQQQFKNLAGEINGIVNRTESDGNKLLGRQGRNVSVMVGPASTIIISPKHVGIDTNRVDLSIAPGAQGALVVGAALEEVKSYRKYLSGKTEELTEVSTALELDMSEAAKSTSRIERILALRAAAETLNRIIERSRLLTDIQAAVEPDIALKLLSE